MRAWPLSNQRILNISDLHAPYQHPDAIKFLRAIKSEYDPDTVICMGDEADKHALSFHDHDPDLPSAGDELKKAKDVIQEIADIYPKVTVLESNHGSMAYRKAMSIGIPKAYIRPYAEVLGVPWKWVPDLQMKLPNKAPCYWHHGKSANSFLALRDIGTNFVQAHFHEKFNIHYHGSAERLIWVIATGCLVDEHSLAMAYNNTNMKRPIVGSSIIIDSYPRLLPMVLKRNGRWDGRVY